MQFIATQSILELCEETERTPGALVGMRWWDQAGIDLTGSKKRESSATDVYEDREGQCRGGI